MSGNAEDNLERELASLTRWEGGDVDAWRAALAADRATKRGGNALRFSRRYLSGWVPLGIAAAALALFVVPVFHSLGSGVARVAAKRSSAEYSRKPADARPGVFFDVLEGKPTPTEFVSPSSGDAEDALRNSPAASVAYSTDNMESYPQHYYTAFAGEKQARFQSAPSGPNRSADATDRHVIRKANIELRAADVRATFLKAAHLVSEARGEYVQESSLTGSERRLEANLTLRVAAERLSAVLQALRELGTVRTETAGGEDVTTQVVDLEARLKNEQRVEAELLQLMEKRTDAPLKEVLELRTAIGNVRQTIETITAQRERLSRLVSLATVLVIIRPADAAEPTPPGLWDYFTTAISRAAERGLQALINTVAGFVLVLIGGAVWIILVAIGAVLLFRRLRSATRTV